MIKKIIASTTEVNDVQLAVSQIKSQLNLENLLENSLGIISCHSSFISSGVVKAVCEALPFDTVGGTSTRFTATNEPDLLPFTIMLLTSDDVEFVSYATPSLAAETTKSITESYKDAATGRYGRPSLILTYAPFIKHNNGDNYIEIITAASYGAPCFGTIVTDDSDDFLSGVTIFNGEVFSDRMIISLFYGSVRPKFYIANISLDKVYDSGEGAVITKSNGSTLMQINNRPASDFFEELGLSKAIESKDLMHSLPFLLDYNDGTPRVARIFTQITPERYIVCAGAVPEGSTIQVATNERNDILFTTGAVMDDILKDTTETSGLLIHACLSRGVSLGGDPLEELSLVNFKINAAEKKLPILMSFAGGEVCPTTNREDKAINRFHNNTFVACLF
jgi:hypothetical protein